MIFKDKYADIANRFNQWSECLSTGNTYIADIALDTLNRAQDSLWDDAPNGWDYLCNDHVQLSLGGATGLEVTFPADCGRVLAVYCDATGTQKPTIYYYKDGQTRNGFRFISLFDKSSGYVWSAKFYYAPISSPFARYQVVLQDFTGTGDEYSAFPSNLLLLEAQRIRCREKGMANEWDMLKGEYESELRKFKQAHQGNNEDMSIEINDANGLPVSIGEYSLGNGSTSRQVIGRTNDRDGVRY